MIEFKINKEDINKAQILAENLGELNNSITKGEGNVAGYIGQIKVLEIIPDTKPCLKKPDLYDFDIVFKNVFKIDVKTKRTAMDFVLPYYEASIADYNPNQKCNIYLFTRVNIEKKIGWLIGYISPSEYYKKSHFLKKGELDESNNYVVKADCWNLPYRELYPIEQLIEWRA